MRHTFLSDKHTKKTNHKNQIVSFNFPSILTILPSCFHHALKCVPSFFQNLSHCFSSSFHHVPHFRIILHDVFIIFRTFMMFSYCFYQVSSIFSHVSPCFHHFPYGFCPFQPIHGGSAPWAYKRPWAWTQKHQQTPPFRPRRPRPTGVTGIIGSSIDYC